MTDLLHVGRPSVASRTTPRIPQAMVLYVVAFVAVTTGVCVAVRSIPGVTPEWQLALLLRFMAAVKAVMLCGAIGLAHWRLRAAVPISIAAGYIGGIGLMALAPPLIWSLAHVALGASLFHAGLFAFLVAAWRDDAPGRLLPRKAGRP